MTTAGKTLLNFNVQDPTNIGDNKGYLERPRIVKSLQLILFVNNELNSATRCIKRVLTTALRPAGNLLIPALARVLVRIKAHVVGRAVQHLHAPSAEKCV